MSEMTFRLYCGTSNAPTHNYSRLLRQPTFRCEKALGHGTFAPATEKSKATGSNL
jgi:hypothetical protein